MRNLWLFLMLMLLCCACNEKEITTAISHKEANDIVCILGDWGIPASLEKKDSKGKIERYVVTVKQSKEPEARSILNNNGLLKNDENEPSQGLQDSCKKEGFFSIRTAEDLAICEDTEFEKRIEEELEKNTGVMTVRASVINKRAKSPDEVSIFVSIVTRDENKITEESVVNVISEKMVHGIDKSKISASIHVIPSIRQRFNLVGISENDGEVIAKPLVPFLGFWNIPDSDFNSLSISITVAVSLALLVGVVTGYMLSLMKKRAVNSDDTDVSELVTFRDDTATRTGKEF